jgi:hypothetical protein
MWTLLSRVGDLERMNASSDGPDIDGRGILVSHLHDQFWSREYYEAARLVRRWQADRGTTWASDFFRLLDHVDGLDDSERSLVADTNAARRLIKSYFRKAQQLCVRGLLTEGDLREHLTMAQRLALLFLIIEPLERARKADYNREMFDFYDSLHGETLERPER